MPGFLGDIGNPQSPPDGMGGMLALETLALVRRTFCLNFLLVMQNKLRSLKKKKSSNKEQEKAGYLNEENSLLTI